MAHGSSEPQPKSQPKFKYEEVKDAFSNITVVCALLIGVNVSTFGTVPMSDLLLLNYQCGLLRNQQFREIVLFNLKSKNFNFTKEILPGYVFDIESALQERAVLSRYAGWSDDGWARVMTRVFHMTKDQVDPWVMSMAAPGPGAQCASGLATCYLVSTFILSATLLAAFVNFHAVASSNFVEMEEQVVDKQGVNPKATSQLNGNGEGTQDANWRLWLAGWYLYVMLTLLVLTTSAGTILSGAALMILVRGRFPDPEMVNASGTPAWVSALVLFIGSIVTSWCLHAFLNAWNKTPPLEYGSRLLHATSTMLEGVRKTVSNASNELHTGVDHIRQSVGTMSNARHTEMQRE